jgi:hemerythrin superfamily protein
MDERRDFIEILIADHVKVEQLFAEIEQLFSERKTPAIQRTIGDLTSRTIMELVKHFVAEEAYLYPSVRTKLPNGDEIVDLEIAAHSLAEETMKQLDGLSPSNAKYKSTVRRLAEQIREHVGKEEARLLPALGGTMTQEERLQLGEALERSQSLAPTQQPAGGPSLNKLLGPGVAIVDRVRDLLHSCKN